MSGKCMPPMAAARVALPKNIWRGVKVTFWTCNFHFTTLLATLPGTARHTCAARHIVPTLFLEGDIFEMTCSCC